MTLTRRTAASLLAGAPALALSREADAATEVATSGAGRMRRYNVVWNSPSKDASGVMPIGNGDIAAGVYAIENGDLYLLLSKNDAFTYVGDIFKTGRCGFRSSPIPSSQEKHFVRRLIYRAARF